MIDIDGTPRHGEVRARAIDDDPGTNEGEDLWILVQWTPPRGRALVRWFPATRVRAATPTDTAGILQSNISQLRHLHA